jgi:TRAP-type C4-dicarboxylate transport system substrate-binding protein
MVNIEHPGSSAILQKEWEEKNIKFIGDGGIYYSIMMSSSGVMTKDFSFTSLADLKGKKIGSGSAQPELKGTGIVVVNVQRPDMYEALARGLVDGMMGSLDEMNDNKLYEVGKYIMEFNMLTVSAGGFLAMNRQAWNSLPPDLQTIFEKGVDVTYKQFEGASYKEHEAILATFRKAGIKLGKFSPEENQMLLDRINEIRRKDYLSICKKAGKLAEAELMVKYCDEILTKLKSQ